MPIRSKAQMRWLFASENRGELPQGTAKRWVKETTGSLRRLPERIKKKSNFDLGIYSYLKESAETIKLPSKYKKRKAGVDRNMYHPSKGLAGSTEDGSAGNFSFTQGTDLSQEPNAHLSDGTPTQFKE